MANQIDNSSVLQSDKMIFNGIDAATGSYLLPEMTPAQISGLAQGFNLPEAELDEIKRRVHDINNPHAGVEADARDLSQTGWGVIFAHDADQALLDALSPLLDLRRGQAGELFKAFTNADGYRPGESKSDFLERHDMGPGPVNPEKVPYYLLLVGGPETIPFSFQYQMDVQYAVGRISFDTIEAYAIYAWSVIQAEKTVQSPPRAAFFGVANPDDRATSLSSEYLVKPLAENLGQKISKWSAITQAAGAAARFPAWEIQTHLGEQATRQGLSSLLESPDAPGLLFSASHGIGFPNGHEKQRQHQGALVCQDWPGPQLWRGPISEDFYFAGDHLSSDANLLGSMAFFFACYGAGTPREDEFARQIWSDQPERREIAPQDFVARLPQRMLSLPKGGALAVVGHVERAWGVSFLWGQAGPQLRVFQDCFERLIKGNYPIGYALEVFNNRYAEISSDLTLRLNEIRNYFKKPDDMALANLWTANNDARNYILLGDPAVRLNTTPDTGSFTGREVLPEISAGVAKSAALAPASEPVKPQAQSGAGGTDPAVDYGLMESFKQAQSGLSASLQNFVGQLGIFLGKALDNATSLEVATYVSDEMDSVRFENGRFSGARLRALTRIEIDGDTLICVPQEDGELDLDLWNIHMDMVKQAQVSRAELLKTVVSTATGLVDLLKP